MKGHVMVAILLALVFPFARVGSGDSFDIGTWEQGDNPGAGSQDFTVFTDTGLNGNFKRLWRAIKNLLNADGTIQSDKLTGANLIPGTTVDGSTIEFNNATGAKTLRIKDLGVTAAKIANATITVTQLATDSVDSTILKDDAAVDANRAVTTNHIRDAAVTSAKIASVSIDHSKFNANGVGYQIYGDTRIAGLAAGNTVAAITEWTETSASDVIKIAVHWHPQNGDRYIRFVCRIKSSSGAQTAKATLSDGSTSVTVTTTATSYDLASTGIFGSAAIDYGAGGYNPNAESSPTRSSFPLTIALACTGGATASLRDVVIYVTKG